MRVLLTTDTVGGVWTYTKVLAEGLLDQGHAVALVSFGALPSPDQLAWSSSTQQTFGNRFRYTLSDIPLEWMPANDHVLSAGTALLLEIASEFQPDLLHSNQFCFGQLPLGIPRLVVAHSDVLSWADACSPAGLDPSLWLDRYIQLVQDGLHGVDHLVAPTHWMLHALSDHFILPSQSGIIPNGRTLPGCDLSAPRLRQAATAGRMDDPSKNLAALHAVRACPLYVAGASSDAAPSHDSDSTMTMLGFLSESDLLALFRNSRIYIAASLYEPFGLAPLEAALCGCAIVANDLASFHEVWGSAALYFRTPAELESHLVSLTTDDALFTHRQALCLHQAQTYSAHCMTASYINLYRDLLSVPRPAYTVPAPARTYVN